MCFESTSLYPTQKYTVHKRCQPSLSITAPAKHRKIITVANLFSTKYFSQTQIPLIMGVSS